MGLDNDTSAPPALLVKRGRLGNFQFSFATEHGRLNGTVTVAIRSGQSQAEIEDAAHRKILTLIQAFAAAAK